MTTLLAFIFVISVLVFVHELGHFLMARYFGVRVLTFSLGFGPKLLKFRRGATEYCLSAIPLGGYLKMAGEYMTEARATSPDEFVGRPRWQRCLILLAGPAMNVGLTVVICTGMLLYGVELPVHRAKAPIVGTVVEQSPAERAGLRQGDLVLQIGEQSVTTWTQLDQAIQARPKQAMTISVLRAERIVTMEITPAPDEPLAARNVGILPEAQSNVPTATSGGAASGTGITAGDQRPSSTVAQTEAATELDGEQQSTVVFESRETTRSEAVSETATLVYRPSASDAFVSGVRATVGMGGTVLATLTGLASGELPLQKLAGPVGIARLAGESVQISWMALFGIMALVSLNLGLFNLLPIPILDGGHITMLAIEGMRGRDFTIRVKGTILRAGLALLLFLIATTLVNDVGRLW